MQAAPKKKKIENQAGCAKENKIENQAVKSIPLH